MDEILHHLETMVETIGIYVGEPSETRVSERWCLRGFPPSTVWNKMGMGQNRTTRRPQGFCPCFHFPGQAILWLPLFDPEPNAEQGQNQLLLWAPAGPSPPPQLLSGVLQAARPQAVRRAASGERRAASASGFVPAGEM